MQNNLIFLTEFDLDKPIYRVFSFTRLMEIFNERKLTLVKPKDWEDPFENFILSSTGYLSDGQEFQMGFRENFYGQCWSLTKESDAMWRIYSPNSDGVKVKTTIRKLFTPLFNLGGHHQHPNGEIYNLTSFIGKVQYQSSKKLMEMLKDEQRMNYKIFDQSGRGQASTFFYKRVAFRHENEIRIIFNSVNNITHDSLYKFDIDPNQLIEEIVFDPRMAENVYDDLKRELLNVGFQNSIIQSGLYKIKNFRIRLTLP